MLRPFFFFALFQALKGMSRQQLGRNPVGLDDTATVGFIEAIWPGHSHYVSTTSDFTLALPTHPVDHQMELFEVYCAAAVTLSCPSETLLMAGLPHDVFVGQGKTAFFGFRYSAHSSAWFLLSFASQ